MNNQQDYLEDCERHVCLCPDVGVSLSII